MTRWYRAYEGTVTDAKLGEVALVAECSRSVAIAAWHCILESAAACNDSGRFDATPRRIAVILGEPVATIERVIAEMTALSMISDATVTAWKARQFESDSSTERSRKHRERRRNTDATLQGRCATPPETETEIEVLEPDGSNTSARARLQAGEPDLDDRPKPDRRAKPEEIRKALSAVIGDELADAVIEHRRRLRKPLTVRAASLLAGKFVRCRDGPVAAAEAMIANGWQGFEAHWMDARNGNGNRTNPQHAAGIMDARRNIIADLQAREAARREPVCGFGADRRGEEGSFGGQILALPSRAGGSG